MNETDKAVFSLNENYLESFVLEFKSCFFPDSCAASAASLKPWLMSFPLHIAVQLHERKQRN